MKRAFLLLLLAPLLARADVKVQSPDVNVVQFEAANRLYEEKKFPAAATGYETVVKGGSASPALWFNLGNAYFKSGQLGRAVVAYRRAAQATPRDPDVRANLQFARQQVQGPRWHAPGWNRVAGGGFSLNEWAVFTAIGVWLTFLSLAAAVLQPEFKSLWRGGVKIFGAMTALQTVGLVASLLAHSPELAVVTVREANAHHGPLEESANAFTAHDGAELRVLDHKDDWLQVTDDARHTGWLKRTEVAPVN
ncbi:MAG: tetratricopeptide repeat protein [Pedosphaera sp.]|nr:tetratricopeptide repeat protein [Pedosphaera sp.]